MTIPVYNFETEGLEKSYLTGPYSAGSTTISVKNNNRFAANDRVMIGEMGQEHTEIVTVSAASGGNDLTVGATVYAHSADDPVYVLPFDQVKFYRASSLSGSYSLIATVALDVDNGDLQTKYDDTTGATTDYYKFTFYHSIDLIESAYSDPIGGSGWRRDQVGNIIDEILSEVSDKNEINISRSELLGYFNDVNDDLQMDGTKPYDFLHTTTTLARTANLNYVAFPTDSYGRQTMWKFDRMDYNFVDTSTDPDTDRTTTIKVISDIEFRNKYSDNTVSTTTVSDDTPEAMALDTAVNRFYFSSPFETTDSDAFTLYYWKFFDVIDSEGDSIETPTPKIYKLYCKAMYYRKRAISEPSFGAAADRYYADYLTERSRYRQADRKDAGTPRGFRPRSSSVTAYRR